MSRFCHGEVALLCLSFHQWWELLEDGFAYVAQTYAELARCPAPLLECFSSLVGKENNWILMLWLFWWSSSQSWLRFLLVHCFGGSPGADYMLSPRWSQKVLKFCRVKGWFIATWQFITCSMCDKMSPSFFVMTVPVLLCNWSTSK